MIPTYTPTKPIRYEKYCIFHINDTEYTLIDYLREKRKEKKITKKFISNLIKKNDYWYSQIEMGKVDNNRRKFIVRPDLVDIISIIIYDARTSLDLERFEYNSKNYIDNILKLPSYDKHLREIPVYELINNVQKSFTHNYSDKRINDCLTDLNSTIKNFYKKCNPIEQDSIINFLNTLILNLSLEPILTLHYCGLPFCSFFSAQPKDERAKEIIDNDVLTEIDSILEKYSKLLCKTDMELIIKRLIYHIANTERLLNNPFNVDKEK